MILLIIGAIVLGAILVLEHKIRRMFQRRCPHCGSLRVQRIHKMHLDDSARLCTDSWRHFKTYTFD